MNTDLFGRILQKFVITPGLVKNSAEHMVESININCNRELLEVAQKLGGLRRHDFLPAFGHNKDVYDLKPPDSRHYDRCAGNHRLKYSVRVWGSDLQSTMRL